MPTYEYKCTKCNYAFEMFQPMSAEPIKDCPNCKGEVKRLIGTGTGPIFKGSGFYQTDYKNKTTQNSEKKNGADKTDKKDSDKGSKKEKEN